MYDWVLYHQCSLHMIVFQEHLNETHHVFIGECDDGSLVLETGVWREMCTIKKSFPKRGVRVDITLYIDRECSVCVRSRLECDSSVAVSHPFLLWFKYTMAMSSVPAYVACLCKDVVVHAPLGPPSPGVPTVHSTFRSFHQPWEIDQTRQLAAGTHYMQPMYCTDIVPIKVHTLSLSLY